MAREYSVWNAAVAALQFWTVDLKAHILSSTIDQVFNAFFYSTSTHMLHQQSDEILFGHFMTTLNAMFESKLALEDKGYKSGSENFNIPTDDIYNSCKPTIISAINLINTNPSFNGKSQQSTHHKRSLFSRRCPQMAHRHCNHERRK